ncbi:MAG: ABC-F family ATP-binding cassette domain-containing protein [Spirochaetales bacterium]|nr:ABC-F family ATP-binding cassette domain-containing protein [Spirochaetales bacterium]
MNLVSVKELSHTEGGRSLFNDITFGIDDDSRIALVGRNGCGKSTLLRLIAGSKEVEGGAVTRNRELKCAFLEQSPSFKGDELIADFILAGDSEEMRLIKEYEKVAGGHAKDSEPDLDEMSKLMSEMERLECWSLENRIHSILTELGIFDLTLKMKNLSGGMVKKAAIARTLVLDANLIILDEPTNHIDIITINWLEKYLKNNKKALLIVTHDRYFMDSICNKIFEIDEEKLFIYDGNYSDYLGFKAMRTSAKEKEADKISNILRNEAEWIKRGPRARAGKDKKRTERFFDLMDRRESVRPESASFGVESKRLGGKILEIEEVSHSWGSLDLIKNFSFGFKKGDRLGIVGANGSGKSTLLDIISGRLVPDSGTVDIGINTKIGYYDQHSRELPNAMKVAEYIKETAEVIKLKDGSTLSPAMFLELFLFPKNLMYTEISNLSGGEKRKLYLLNMLLTNPNLLIFDEPTNDFDIQTLSILEDFLTDFSGCSVIVSHDRFFLDRTTDFLFILDGKGGVTGFSGDVTTYYSEEKADKEPSATGKEENTGRKTRTEKKGPSFKEKKEFEAIEDEISRLEQQKDKLEQLFASPDLDTEQLSANTRDYEKLNLEIEKKYSRWEYLESLNS